MRKVRVLLILGIFMTILPYSGFPYSWKDVLSTVIGLLVIYVSYFLYRDSKTKKKEEEQFDNFIENNNFEEKEL
jgi:Ca2+/Na+ antiporter